MGARLRLQKREILFLLSASQRDGLEQDLEGRCRGQHKTGQRLHPVDYIKGLDGNFMIDPCVFIDTDGKAYFYYGGGGKCEGGKLKDNMVELDGPMKKMEGLVDFHEATWVFQAERDLLSHLLGQLSPDEPAAIRDELEPAGPMDAEGRLSRSHRLRHESRIGRGIQRPVVCFYHNKSISGQGNLRSICVDKLTFNPDGTIQKVVQTKEGVPSVGPAPTPDPETVKYRQRTRNSAVKLSLVKIPRASGGKCIQNLHLADSSFEFDKVNGGKGGRATIDVSYSAASNTKLKLMVNGVDYSFLNTISTGGWNAYKGHAYFTVPLKPGSENTIKLTGGNGGVNVDYVAVTPLPPEVASKTP